MNRYPKWINDLDFCLHPKSTPIFETRLSVQTDMPAGQLSGVTFHL